MNSFELGDGVVVRVGRYGPFLERADRRASIPDDLPPDELTLELAEKLLAQNSEGRSLGTDPEAGREIVARDGRYGPYVTEVLPDDEKTKPRSSSLFKTMSVETVTLEDALRLLSLPRVVGVDPSDGQEIMALNGRYGPYLKKGEDTRSLDSEEELFTVGVEEAVAAFTRPKTRGRRGASTPPLRTLGADPTTKREVTLRSGRYGPYVTDGETNASLRKGDDPETVTIERAAELLADRRAAPKTTRRKRKK
jgi:DNA topoisomerase-1